MKSARLFGFIAAIVFLVGLHAPVASAIAEENLPSQSDTTTNSDETTETTTDTTTTVEIPEIKSAQKKTRSSVGGLTFIADDAVSIDQPVESDLISMGNSIQIIESVGDDVFAAGNTVTIDGDVGGSVRVAGNTIVINGTVNGNVLVFGNTVRVGKNAVIEGHLTAMGSKIIVEGRVMQSASVSGEEVILNGEVLGELTVNAEEAQFGPRANVHTTTVATPSGSATIDASAVGTENITYSTASFIDRDEAKSERAQKHFYKWLFSFIFFAIIGSLLIVLWPTWTARVVHVMETERSMSWQKGTLFFFVVPTVALLLILTIIGIPFGLLLMVFYVAALFLGKLFAGMLLGWHLAHDLRRGAEKKHQIMMFVVGYFILSLAISVPMIGWLICILASMWGMGGVLAARKKKA